MEELDLDTRIELLLTELDAIGKILDDMKTNMDNLAAILEGN